MVIVCCTRRALACSPLYQLQREVARKCRKMSCVLVNHCGHKWQWQSLLGVEVRQGRARGPDTALTVSLGAPRARLSRSRSVREHFDNTSARAALRPSPLRTHCTRLHKGARRSAVPSHTQCCPSDQPEDAPGPAQAICVGWCPDSSTTIIPAHALPTPLSWSTGYSLPRHCQMHLLCPNANRPLFSPLSGSPNGRQCEGRRLCHSWWATISMAETSRRSLVRRVSKIATRCTTGSCGTWHKDREWPHG